MVTVSVSSNVTARTVFLTVVPSDAIILIPNEVKAFAWAAFSRALICHFRACEPVIVELRFVVGVVVLVSPVLSSQAVSGVGEIGVARASLGRYKRVTANEKRGKIISKIPRTITIFFIIFVKFI